MGTTIGANDDGTRDRPALHNRSQIICGVAAGCIIILATIPGVALTYIGALIAYEQRRIRVKVWWRWVAATFLAGIAFAGMSLSTWAFWSSSFVARVWWPAGTGSGGNGIHGWIDGHTDASVASVIWTQAWFGMPIGILLTIITIVLFRSRARSLRGRIEGDEHSNMRPVGLYDHYRRRRERSRIASGYYTTRSSR
ncbi:MAG: hypothetical protein L0H59_00170 [Tomitella sp.]|nr:hypothetical protein [Tomitella sp.]